VFIIYFYLHAASSRGGGEAPRHEGARSGVGQGGSGGLGLRRRRGARAAEARGPGRRRVRHLSLAKPLNARQPHLPIVTCHLHRRGGEEEEG